MTLPPEISISEVRFPPNKLGSGQTRTCRVTPDAANSASPILKNISRFADFLVPISNDYPKARPGVVSQHVLKKFGDVDSSDSDSNEFLAMIDMHNDSACIAPVPQREGRRDTGK